MASVLKYLTENNVKHFMIISMNRQLKFFFAEPNQVYSLTDYKNKKLKWGASSRWSFRPNSVWGSIETMTIWKPHPTLGFKIDE